MKSFNKTICVNHSLEQFLPILSISDNGVIRLTVPTFLQAEQKELEQLLNKVFPNRIDTPTNLALAQQLSLNWCVSKAKKTGIADKCVCR